MKAEHRKELHTNLLADRMGRMVQRVRSRPSRRSVLWILLALVVVVVLVGWTIIANNKRSLMSGLWADLGEEHIAGYTEKGQWATMPWVRDYRDTNPGLAARYQLAWVFLWEEGLKQMGSDPVRALKGLEFVEKTFSELGYECKDDPILGPEAAYALAVIEESRAVKDPAALNKAVTRYRGVQTRYKDSAAGKAAARRAEYLEKNRDRAEGFYMVMNRHYDMIERQQAAMLPPGAEKVPQKK